MKLSKIFHRHNKKYRSREANNAIYIIESNGTRTQVYDVKGLDVTFAGTGSVIELHAPFMFQNVKMTLGNNNFVSIGKDAWIEKLTIPHRMSNGSRLIIGNGFSSVDCQIYLHDEPDNSVVIGNDCMFSFGVIIWPSDGHAIVDANDNPKNWAMPITVGDHVWLGMHSRVLKGANIPSNSIIGATSVYTRSSNPENIDKIAGGGRIFAGQPARVIKSGDFTWRRQNCYDVLRLQQSKNEDKK